MKNLQDHLNLIEETVKFYTVEGNDRAIISEPGSSGCYYYYKDKNQKEKFCAVGRCLLNPSEIQKKADEGIDVSDQDFMEVYNNLGKDSIFKDQYKGFMPSLWTDLQILHDRGDYWEEGSLSEEGEKELLKIKNRVKSEFAWIAKKTS